VIVHSARFGFFDASRGSHDGECPGDEEQPGYERYPDHDTSTVVPTRP
jgi:hypothetical protein